MEFDGNWNALSEQMGNLNNLLASSAGTTSHNSPCTSYLDDKEMSTYGSFPMSSLNDLDDGLKVVNCTECLRPVQKSALEEHSISCSIMKQINQSQPKSSNNRKSKLKREEASSTPTPVPSSADLTANPSKKRRLSDASQHSQTSSNSPQKKSRKLDAESLKIKSKSSSSTGSTSKARKEDGPVDLDSQCGVLNAKGVQCSRSLTCKTHSMGAKRAVIGRSKPYDVLTYEFEVKRKPELADKPVPKAVTQFEADRAAAKKRTTPVQTPTPTPPVKPKVLPKVPAIEEKAIGVTSWESQLPAPDEELLPTTGLELDIEISKIRAITAAHTPKALGGPTNRMSGLIRKRTMMRRCLMK
ncbi:SCA7-domain-containing protein [Wallemia mellicola]|uniref:SCA7-domain-containing protein n=2 Tax=Wallemia mellicola TaxID=1708541 RepID=A0A4T0MHZ0_9BASI|nr:SCA7-domain-containing protein [Wallemia mellicola CBS 633.66]TIB74729.1 hypothetical protein E3Q24_00383 [Wallemia mellicola]EIM24216.1 SCA7-domain-containing protein [Wallemia mellicola CBS 633.66]TIB79548.1 hypothetical protein E3Q23_00089 [Wallemia mellicola]TIB82647.1 SCA7-domain-containing protein [Wallemia mellicola]TIB89482.1 SCA7-domain-containing protein [Wallemia mellicola]|eukprot:XP_006956034.1 SCA7-domain-containing protein [Wallemia mellicola CBS 633.66]